MATLTQLYTRLILDLDRDDMGSGGELEQAKIDAVDEAIETYSDEPFWFNRANGTGNTVASTATIALPAGIRFPYLVSYLGEELDKVPLLAIQYRTETGVPSQWAANESTIQLWPIPNAVYTLAVFGLDSTAAPALGASNFWTTEAYRLILNEAKLILCRGPLRDPDGAQMAAQARNEALSGIRSESRRRDVSALRTDLPQTRRTFDITRGY